MAEKKLSIEKRGDRCYLYESESYWDKEKKQGRKRKKYLGPCDEQGNLQPERQRAPAGGFAQQIGHIRSLRLPEQTRTGDRSVIQTRFRIRNRGFEAHHDPRHAQDHRSRQPKARQGHAGHHVSGTDIGCGVVLFVPAALRAAGIRGQGDIEEDGVLRVLPDG